MSQRDSDGSTRTQPVIGVAPVGAPKRRGRPPAAEPGVSLTAWVPAHVYDQVARVANKRGVSMSRLVHLSLQRFLIQG